MNKRTMKKGLAIVLALVMVFAMTATAFASTNTGTATIDVVIVDPETGNWETVDTATVESGQSLMTAIESNFDYYEPVFVDTVDQYIFQTTGQTVMTKQITSFVGYEPANVDYFYNPDTTAYSWSKDWGWIFTVNGNMPTDPQDSEHYLSMEQYTLQAGTTVKVVYAYYQTNWIESTGHTEFTLLNPTA